MGKNRRTSREKGMAIGILFLLFGLSILLKALFHINIPVFRTFLAIFLIYMGIKMLLGGWGWDFRQWRGHGDALFSEESFQAAPNGSKSTHYNTVFGSSKVDLTALKPTDQDIEVEVNTVFGESLVYIDPKSPVSIRSNAAFGAAQMPNENMVAFGTLHYLTDSAKKSSHKILIHGNVAFGSLRIIERESQDSQAKTATGKPSENTNTEDKDSEKDDD
jgi:predicted membrane protein